MGDILKRHWFWPAAGAMLAVMAGVQVSSIRLESQTFDEAMHLAAGYSYWKTGDFRMNPEHPPLFKLLCALPLLKLKPALPVDTAAWREKDQLDFGSLFLYSNRVDQDTMLFWGRLVTIALTVLLGVLLAAWTRARFGAGAALAALFLFAFDPNLIAHGRYVTNDLMAALCIFAAVVAWVKYLESGRWRDCGLAGAALGLALLSKFSALFLAPVFAVLWLFRWWQQRGKGPLSWARLPIACGALVLVSTLMIAVAYGPATVRSLRGPKLRQVVDRSNFTGEVLFQTGKRLGLPAHPFLTGLGEFAKHDTTGHDSYLLGKHSHEGWWYYFPVVFAVKTPTAVLVLLAVCGSLVAWWSARARFRLRRAPLAWVAMLFPALLFFALAMRSHVNLGVRHILPVYPFLFAAIGAALFRLTSARVRTAVLTAAVALQLFESVRIYPDYLAFFNAPSGGPDRGPEYLVDSNIDWGQDMKKLKAWTERNQGKDRLCLDYFGMAYPEYYGVKWEYLPKTAEVKAGRPVDCIAAVSATVLTGTYVPPDDYEWLRERRPFGKIGYSIYLYDLRRP